MIAAAAGAGLFLSELRELSLWEYSATLEGWNAANTPEGESEPLGDDKIKRQAAALKAARERAKKP